MSVARARRVTISRPSACFRLIATLRFPRFTALKLGLSAPTAPGICRVESPAGRSEEHTSELQSRGHLVCRLLLEKKKKKKRVTNNKRNNNDTMTVQRRYTSPAD